MQALLWVTESKDSKPSSEELLIPWFAKSFTVFGFFFKSIFEQSKQQKSPFSDIKLSHFQLKF